MNEKKLVQLMPADGWFAWYFRTQTINGKQYIPANEEPNAEPVVFWGLNAQGDVEPYVYLDGDCWPVDPTDPRLICVKKNARPTSEETEHCRAMWRVAMGERFQGSGKDLQ